MGDMLWVCRGERSNRFRTITVHIVCRGINDTKLKLCPTFLPWCGMPALQSSVSTQSLFEPRRPYATQNTLHKKAKDIRQYLDLNTKITAQNIQKNSKYP